jgi:hypothetical protein
MYKWSIVIYLVVQYLGPFVLFASSIKLPIGFFFAKKLPIDQGVSPWLLADVAAGPARGP